MSLIRNERLKLTAGFLNAIGVLAPLIGLANGTGGGYRSAYVCIGAAFTLHSLARWSLRGLM